MTDPWALVENRSIYRGMLEDLGLVPGGALVPSPSKTNDPAQVDRLMRSREAPEAMAMLASYGVGVELGATAPNWTMSCLPKWAGAAGRRRAATVSIARDEVFYVWMDLGSGCVDSWGMAIDAPVLATLADQEGHRWQELETKHGLFIEGHGFESFVSIAEFEAVRNAARSAIANTTSLASVRQHEWHNPQLAVLLGLDPDGEASEASTIHAKWEVPMSHTLRLVRTRRHQSAFRREVLLHTHPRVCAVCSLGVLEVLEAAHLIPDAEGGPASSSNALLLCANHHRALDSGLFRWTETGAVWASGRSRF